MRIDPIVEQYPVRIRTVIVFVLLGLSITFYAFPRFLGESEKIDYDNSIILPGPDVVTIITKPPPEQIPEKPKAFIPKANDEMDDPFWDEIISWPSFEDVILEDPPESESGMRIPDFVPHEVEPEPIRRIEPVYPEIAQLAGHEGTVIIGFLVRLDGTVSDVYIHSGQPNTGLDEAAVEAVNKSLWKPAMNQDKKVEVWMLVPIEFKLD